LAQGISRVKSVNDRHSRREWLSQRQAQALLSAPDITTVRGLRDRAILAFFSDAGCDVEVARSRSRTSSSATPVCIVDLSEAQRVRTTMPACEGGD